MGIKKGASAVAKAMAGQEAQGLKSEVRDKRSVYVVSLLPASGF